MKKYLSIILSVFLVLSVFAGCSKEEEKKNDQPTEFELAYTYDSHYSYISDSAKGAYEKYCDGIMNYQQEIKFNVSMLDDVSSLFYTSFPLYPLVKSCNINEDGSGVIVEYTLTQEEHMKKIADFKTAIKDIMDECDYKRVSNNEFIVRLYSYLAQNIERDDSIVTVLDTALTKKGIGATVSGLFEYILRQANIEASHIVSLREQSSAKMISIVTFKGEMCLFDPFSEGQNGEGKGLKYFAMDDNRAGINQSSGYKFTDGEYLLIIFDDSYSELKNCDSYSIENNKLTCKIKDSKDFIVDLI